MVLIVTLSGLALLCLLLNNGHALQCITCRGDASPKETTHPCDVSNKAQECNANVAKMSPFPLMTLQSEGFSCFTILSKFKDQSGDTFMDKGCTFGYKKPTEACKAYENGAENFIANAAGATLSCTMCSEDLCNSATRYNFFSFFTLIVILVPIYILI